MYLTCLVKFRSKNRFPRQAQTNEAAFRMMHLDISEEIPHRLHRNKGKEIYHRGSGLPVELTCDINPVCPFNSFLQGVTIAAIDITLAIGANVAAIKGIAVDANHQSLFRVSAKEKTNCDYSSPRFIIIRWSKPEFTQRTDML